MQAASELEIGCIKAVEIWKGLLSAMHLIGGGPGRGTEIGSYSFRTTAANRRSFHFVDTELMIIPTFSKTRALNGGKVEFLNRHLDVEASYLFKVFFLLIHSVLVVFDETLAQNSSSAEPRICGENSVLLGRMEPNQVSTVIGGVFTEYEIHFSFSKYRHLQRRLLKQKGIKYVLRIVTTMSEDNENMARDEDTRDSESLCHASIVQGGHSVRTALLIYAQTSAAGDISLSSESHRIKFFRKASQEWHVDIGLRQTTDSAASKKVNNLVKEASNTSLPDKDNTDRDTLRSQQPLATHKISQDVKEDGMRCSIPQFGNILRLAVSQTLKNLSQINNQNSEFQTPLRICRDNVGAEHAGGTREKESGQGRNKRFRTENGNFERL